MNSEITISLERKQLELVEKCVCLAIQQVESLQHGFTLPLPSTDIDVNELNNIRRSLSSKSTHTKKDIKSRSNMTGSKVYNVCFDHQLEPKDFGNFSTFDKAKDFLINRGISITDIIEYGSVTVCRTSHGDYRIQEVEVA